MTLTLTPEQQKRLTACAKPRSASRLCLLVLVLLLLPVAAPAQNARAAKTYIQAQYRRLAAALTRKDRDAFRSLHAAECVFIAPDGKHNTLDQLIAALAEASSEGTEIQKVTAKIRRITPHPAGYAVLVTEQLTLTKTDNEGELGKKGQRHIVQLTTSGRDLWHNKNGAWLRHKAHMKAIVSLSIDGKRIPKPTATFPSLTPN